MEEQKKLITYTTTKHDGQKETITEIRMVYIDGSDQDRSVYKVTPCKTSKGKFVHTFPLKKSIVIWGVFNEDLPHFVDRLKRMYKRGRILSGYSKQANRLAFCTFGDFVSRDISYKQVKSILLFEKKACRNGIFPHKAIENVDPRCIPESLDLGDYMIETWPRPKKTFYSFITDNEITKKWLDKLVC